MSYNSFDLVVGTVREIKGTAVIVRMFENTNQLYYFLNGKRYSGVIIGSYIGIRRNDYIIIGKIEKEYAEDVLNDPTKQEFKKERFIREIEIKVLGNIYKEEYSMGVAVFPQLFNDVILLSDDQKKLIVDGSKDEIYLGKKFIELPPMKIGELLPDGIDYNLKWYKLFNSHIAIFGNTGSGKSNTLAKIYHELFNYKYKEKFLNFSKSKFLLLDFNGEYVGSKCIISDKEVIELNTRNQDEKKRQYFKIPYSSFWNKNMLSVLFSATEQTQQPFLNRIIEYYFKEDIKFNDSLSEYIKEAFGNVYSMPNKYGLDLLKKILSKLNIENNDISSWIDKTIFNSSLENFYSPSKIEGWEYFSNNGKYYWNNCESENIEQNNILENEKNNVYERFKNQNKKVENIIEQIQIASYLRLIFELRYNIAQYDHIAPLLNRIEARTEDFAKVIKVVQNGEEIFKRKLTVLSLKNVNQDMKQIVPLIVAKSTYENHKYKKQEDEYFNLIVDEAHNILSETSKRESEKWKDYRLEVFEEIIKEGRKFSYFVTISSQRPADISSTIVSQVHNFFIHRLVNDNDLKLLDNTLTSLDRVSKDNIPNFSPGQVILTGVLFELPLIIQIDMLDKDNAPNSSNISLINNWLDN